MTRTVLALALLLACDHQDAGEPDGSSSTSSTSGEVEDSSSSSTGEGSTGGSSGSSTGEQAWSPTPGHPFAPCTVDTDCVAGACILAVDIENGQTRGQCSVGCGDCQAYGPENQAAVGCVDLYPTPEFPETEPPEEPKLSQACLMTCPSFQVTCTEGYECRTVEVGTITAEVCLPFGV